jgi:hypothetical protein
MCLIGPVLGVVGFVQTRRPDYRGRGLAVAGIVLGLLFTTGWLMFGAWWNANVRRPLIDGPGAALQQGFAGNTAGFRGAFLYDGAPPDEREAIAFINQLRQRYGELREVRQAAEAPWKDDATDRTRLRVAYVFDFTKTDVVGEATFVLSNPAGGLVLKWAYIVVRDAAQGDLVYPPGAKVPPSSTTGSVRESDTDDDGQ